MSRFAEDAPRLAFICAMPMELRPLVRKLGLRKTTTDGTTLQSGTLAGREVVAIVTGMGTKLATDATSNAWSCSASPAQSRTRPPSAR